jgi:membrane protein EpsK
MIEQLISIPKEAKSDIHLFIWIVFANFSINLITSIFSVMLYARNRIDLMQFSTIISTILRVIFTIIFFSTGNINLVSVALAITISSLFSLGFAFYHSKKLTKFIKLNLSMFASEYVKPLFSMGGWVLVNQIGFLLFLKVDLLIVNKLIGASEAGGFSLASKFSELIRTFSVVISGVIGPVILGYYSQNNIKTLTDLALQFMRLLSVLISILVIMTVVFSKDLLGLWLGESYQHLTILVCALVIPLAFTLSASPLFNINIAYNKVKIPAVMTLLSAIFGLTISLLLVLNTELGMISLAIGSGVALSLKNLIFIPIYTSELLNINRYLFLFEQMKWGILSMILCFLAFFFNEMLVGYDVLLLTRITVLFMLISLTFYLCLGHNSIKDIFYSITSKDIK